MYRLLGGEMPHPNPPGLPPAPSAPATVPQTTFGPVVLGTFSIFPPQIWTLIVREYIIDVLQSATSYPPHPLNYLAHPNFFRPSAWLPLKGLYSACRNLRETVLEEYPSLTGLITVKYTGSSATWLRRARKRGIRQLIFLMPFTDLEGHKPAMQKDFQDDVDATTVSQMTDLLEEATNLLPDLESLWIVGTSNANNGERKLPPPQRELRSDIPRRSDAQCDLWADWWLKKNFTEDYRPNDLHVDIPALPTPQAPPPPGDERVRFLWDFARPENAKAARIKWPPSIHVAIDAPQNYINETYSDNARKILQRFLGWQGYICPSIIIRTAPRWRHHQTRSNTTKRASYTASDTEIVSLYRNTTMHDFRIAGPCLPYFQLHIEHLSAPPLLPNILDPGINSAKFRKVHLSDIVTTHRDLKRLDLGDHGLSLSQLEELHLCNVIITGTYEPLERNILPWGDFFRQQRNFQYTRRSLIDLTVENIGYSRSWAASAPEIWGHTIWPHYEGLELDELQYLVNETRSQRTPPLNPIRFPMPPASFAMTAVEVDFPLPVQAPRDLRTTTSRRPGFHYIA